MGGNPLSIPPLEDPCLRIQGSLFSSPQGPFSVCRYQSGGIPFVEWVRAMVLNPFGTHEPWLQGKWQNLECEDCADPITCP